MRPTHYHTIISEKPVCGAVRAPFRTNVREQVTCRNCRRVMNKPLRRRVRKHSVRGSDGRFMRDWRAEYTERMAAQSRANIARAKAQDLADKHKAGLITDAEYCEQLAALEVQQ